MQEGCGATSEEITQLRASFSTCQLQMNLLCQPFTPSSSPPLPVFALCHFLFSLFFLFSLSPARTFDPKDFKESNPARPPRAHVSVNMFFFLSFCLFLFLSASQVNKLPRGQPVNEEKTAEK